MIMGLQYIGIRYTHTVLWVIGTPVKEVTHILRMIGTPNAGETKT